MSEADIAKAQVRTVRARAKLSATLATLKERLLPRTIARNVLQATREKAVDAAAAGTEAVKARPAVAIGIAALAALVLARKPIIRAISSTEDETPPDPARSPPRSSRKGKP